MARRGSAEDTETDTDREVELGVPDKETTLRVPLEEPDDGGDDDGEAGAAPAPAPADGKRDRDPVTGKWTDKKRDRGSKGREEKGWRADYEARLERMQRDSDRRMSEMQAQLMEARRAPAPAAGPATDPYAAPLADIASQLEAELKLIETDEKHGYKRYNDLQDKKNALIARREWAAMEAERGGQQRGQQQQPSPNDGRRTILTAEHPWLADPRMHELTEKAWAVRNSLIDIEGRPDTLETDREAITTAVARWGGQFGLRVPAAPSPRTRGFYGGPGSSRGAARGGEEDFIEIPRDVAAGTGLSDRELNAAVRSAANGTRR